MSDGERIAELLASELHGREDGALERVAVVDAVEDVEPTVDGERAYRVAVDGERVADVEVHPDRVHLVVGSEQAAAASVADAAAAEGAALRVRPKASTPPETLVFVESGAAVKAAAEVVAAVVDDAS